MPRRPPARVLEQRVHQKVLPALRVGGVVRAQPDPQVPLPTFLRPLPPALEDGAQQPQLPGEHVGVIAARELPEVPNDPLPDAPPSRRPSTS